MTSRRPRGRSRGRRGRERGAGWMLRLSRTVWDRASELSGPARMHWPPKLQSRSCEPLVATPQSGDLLERNRDRPGARAAVASLTKGEGTMKPRTMKPLRLAVAATGALVAATIVAAGPLAAQSASAVPTTLVKCRSMQSGSFNSTVELGACTRPNITGGSGTSNGFGSGPYPLTWFNAKITDFSTVSSSLPSPSRCPTPMAELDFVGSVSHVVGPWTKRILGAPVAFDVCLTDSLGITELVPGTVFTMKVPKP